MGRTAVVFEASRDGYTIGQVADDAMTVGQLRAILSQYDDDELFILSHDQGYTYGSVNDYEIEHYEETDPDEGEWEVT